MPVLLKRHGYTIWIALLVLITSMHFWHLRADFPNHSPWQDWAKYTDEGWYGNAAVRAHLFGNWYVPGDFNPAPAVPLWPFLEWLLFFITGVSIQAARGLSLAFFLLNLGLAYKLFRERGPRWAGLLAVTLIATSPFLYAFSRLAILEPMLLTLTLLAMNLGVRLPRFRRQELVAAIIGLLFTLMMLTKTTAVFLLPSLVWVMSLHYRNNKRRLVRLLVAAGGTAALSFSLWMLLIVSLDLFPDYKYLFFINDYEKGKGLLGHFMSFWWSFHGGLWADPVLIPVAGILILGAIWCRKQDWTASLWRDPVFGGSMLAAAGYIGFMTYQNHPQPRYYTVVAFFSFFIVVRVMAQLLYRKGLERRIGLCFLAVVSVTVVANAAWTLHYVFHPEYTYVRAAENLTNYIDTHPNGRRLLVSISGDEITMMTHLPSLCDDFGTQELVGKLATYHPGWYATWNDFDPGTLEDLHRHYWLEQVAAFPALDDPERNVLYLFKLHPWKDPAPRTDDAPALQVPLPEDKIDIPIE